MNLKKRVLKNSFSIFLDTDKDAGDALNESDNVTFTEQDLLQAVNLAKFSYDRLKT